jgi:hypothetical protein
LINTMEYLEEKFYLIQANSDIEMLEWINAIGKACRIHKKEQTSLNLHVTK